MSRIRPKFDCFRATRASTSPCPACIGRSIASPLRVSIPSRLCCAPARCGMKRLAVPADTPADGEIHQHRIEGPQGVALRVVERTVTIDTHSLRLMVAANESLMTEPIADFKGHLWMALVHTGSGIDVRGFDASLCRACSTAQHAGCPRACPARRCPKHGRHLPERDTCRW
jgi:hypothetical protein